MSTMPGCFTTPNRCVIPAVEPSSCSSKNLVSSRDVKIKDDIHSISRLPDVLLCDILSFLPTKEAVATSVLAKRWRHLFTWLPHLDIHDSPISDSINCWTVCPDPILRTKFATFRRFVHNLLRSFQSESITKFRLSFGKTEYFSDGCCYTRLRPKYVNAWLCFPLTRGVRILDLCVYVKEPGKLPPAIFSCQTLEVLKIDTNLALGSCPINVSLPNLKVLDLCVDSFPADDTVARLVSSCPILEDLCLTGVKWDAANPINISAPSLRTLDIYIKHDRFERRKAYVFDTPNLEYLSFWDSLALQYSIGDLNSLTEARFYLHLGYVNGERASVSLSRLLRSLSNVRRLYLTKWVEEFEVRKVKIHWPVFQNLNRLDARFEGRQVWHEAFMKLLYSSPNLETLVFEEVTLNSDKGAFLETAERETRFWRTAEDVPYCVQTHIKKVAIEKYWGIEWEMELVKYFLSKALGLEELEIACEASVTMADRLSLETTLQNLPRASLSCSIQVRGGDNP